MQQGPHCEGSRGAFARVRMLFGSAPERTASAIVASTMDRALAPAAFSIAGRPASGLVSAALNIRR